MRDARHYATRAPGNVPPKRGAEWCPRLAWSADEPPRFNTPVVGQPIPVVANHGRWVVSCECGGAQLACRTDHRFMCCDCGNASNDGCWRPVIWPDDPDAIAAELDVQVRPMQLRNWLPGETPQTLQAENALLAELAEHGPKELLP